MTKHKTQIDSSTLDRSISRKNLMHWGDVFNHNSHLPCFTADIHSMYSENEYSYGKQVGVNKKKHRADIGGYGYNPHADSLYGIDKHSHAFEQMRTPFDDDWEDYLD